MELERARGGAEAVVACEGGEGGDEWIRLLTMKLKRVIRIEMGPALRSYLVQHLRKRGHGCKAV